ncbi:MULTISPECIES: ECF transporter S component [Pseudonocardia]|uniref:ABC-type cobalt transport system, permease component n=2 Tax=Pseudonocardia TaxID=1847 RepID=A0A1Y2N089_PSEAH|nr:MULTISPECIES: ECF transporter S component [Pseudonocardia]OSY40832.1 ABC-type cobalt transport system, permease component [Pseudonocardia autotrophica]TDN71860.1 energy-coupling factor transport system substrate-specific component [Pseudonocardia autotrophica]BBG02548.1 thiamine ABC transporter permease [Pseudonocardia autotrophica]GEC24607.1 thiamine ABC transporter permease [Pseudonocardia saturnea]
MSRNSSSTRVILTCGALGVALGIVLVPANLVTIAFMATAPLLVLSLMGVWLLPPLAALALLRRPGVGLLTSVIAGLVTVPLTPFGWMGLFQGLLWGVLCEIPFALTRYRRWSAWLFTGTGLVVAVIGLIPTYTTYGLDQMAVPVMLLAVVLTIASCVLAGYLSVLLARALGRTGIAPAPRVRATDAPA